MCVCECECDVCECVFSVVHQISYSDKLLDFNGSKNGAPETGGFYLIYSQQSSKETLRATLNQASIKGHWISTMASLLSSSRSAES